MPTIEQSVQEIKDKYFKTELAVGKIVEHPRNGKVLITSGCFWDPTYGRLSNFWTWRKVGAAGKPRGRTYKGYGWM